MNEKNQRSFDLIDEGVRILALRYSSSFSANAIRAFKDLELSIQIFKGVIEKIESKNKGA